MSVLNSRNATGALLLKAAPVGTPLFDVDAPGVGLHGMCSACHVTAAEFNRPTNLSGAGVAAVQQLLSGYHNTSTQ